MRNYTVLEGITNTYGKWPKAFGDGVFLDSAFLFENMIEMIYKNVVVMMTRNSYSMNALMQVDNIYIFVKEYMKDVKEGDYAMQVHVMVKDRMKKYLSPNGNG